jgi:ABC-type nitrate/sulfonate/bicarbonate transport system substrate-binding protein
MPDVCAAPGSTLRRTGLLLGVALLACTGSAEQAAKPRDKLRVIIQPFLAHAPLLIAQAESLFARQGLDVEFVEMTRITEAVPLLLSGEIDVLPSSLQPAALNAMARGEKIRIVADRGYLDPQGCTFMAIVIAKTVSPSAAARTVKRISLEKQISMYHIEVKSLEHVGLAPKNLDVVEVPNAPEMDALEKGALDAAFVGEPWLSRNLDRGAHMWIRAQDVLPNLQYGFVIYGPKLLDGDPDIGRRFMIAYRQAVAQYLEGKTPRNVEILVSATRDTPELVQKSCWPAMRADGRIDMANVLEYQAWAESQGYVETPATPAQIWDSSFVTFSDSRLNRGLD